MVQSEPFAPIRIARSAGLIVEQRRGRPEEAVA